MQRMTAAEFAQRAMQAPGIPWVRWRSDWAACDCFGLVVLFYRVVHGLELGPVPQTDIASGFAAARGWRECEAAPGASAWMAFDAGTPPRPRHCGVVLDALHLLHSEGQEGGGGVRITRLAVMRRLYPDTRFFRPTAC